MPVPNMPGGYIPGAAWNATVAAAASTNKPAAVSTCSTTQSPSASTASSESRTSTATEQEQEEVRLGTRNGPGECALTSSLYISGSIQVLLYNLLTWLYYVMIVLLVRLYTSVSHIFSVLFGSG